MTFSPESGTVDATTVTSTRNVRFALRKKRTLNGSSKTESPPVSLSSYNSDFLSGLFADVAKANVLKELSIELPCTTEPSPQPVESCPSSIFDSRYASHVVPESRESPRPFKKSRVSSKSYRSRASCMNLLEMRTELDSSSTSTSSRPPNKTRFACDGQSSFGKQPPTAESEVLAASPVTSAPQPSEDKSMKGVAALAFPILPTTISDSSCESSHITATGLTRERCQVQHGPASEIAANASSGSKESFGWFVDLDSEASAEDFNTTPVTNNRIGTDLAFQAPTAPKCAVDSVQEEMEQAYAADTIDSVLGDLF